MAPSGAVIRVIRSRSASRAGGDLLDGLAAHPQRHQEARIWAGVASPVIIMSNASRASAWSSGAPGRGLGDQLLEALQLGRHAATAPTRGQVEEIAQQLVAVLGLDALGVELDAVDRQRRVAQAHDRAVRGPGVDLEAAGRVSRLATSEW